MNQFNSYIALETAQQQRDLNRYKNEAGKYDTKYKNYWKTKESIGTNRSITNSRFNDNSNFNNMGANSISMSKSNLIVNIIKSLWVLIIFIIKLYSIISFIKKYRKSENYD